MLDFFDFCSEMLCVADHRGYFVHVNSAWTKTLGWSSEELTSRPYIEFVHPDDVAATIREASLLQSDEYETVHFQNRYRCKDGSYRWLAWQAKNKPDSDDLLATARDVTDEKLHLGSLKASQEQLKSSQRRLRALFDQAPVGIAAIDSHTGRFLELNSKYAEILGRPPQEILELDFQSVTHPDDLQEDLDNMALLIRGDIQQFRMHKRYLRPDGSVRWVDLTVVPLWQDGEVPSQHLAIVEDITERREAEEQLQTREAQLAGLLENSSNIVYLKDRQGRYLLTNRSFHRLFDLQESEIVGRTDFDLFGPQTGAIFQTSDRQVWGDEQPHTFEETVPQDDGPHVYRSVKFPVTDRSGNMLAIGGISTDITDLTTANERLAEKERLLRNLIDIQEKEKAFICYEFHDGLIQYAVAAAMMLEGYHRRHPTADSPDTITEVVESLRRGVKEARGVIRGIRPTVLDDLGLLPAIEDLIDQRPAAHIATTIECDYHTERLPPEFEATVYRVVQEALNNAWKHSRSDRVRVRIHQPDDSLVIEVQDFGCGFDPAAGRQKGFGLLGMIERVRLLGGESNIESAPGAGTRIVIQLPIRSKEAAPLGEPDS